MNVSKDYNQKNNSLISINTLIQSKKNNSDKSLRTVPLEEFPDQELPVDTSLETAPLQKAVADSGTIRPVATERGITGEAALSSGIVPVQTMEIPGNSSLAKAEASDLKVDEKTATEEDSKSSKEPKMAQSKKMMAAVSGGDDGTGAGLNNLNSLHSGGEPLPENLQAKMEQSIGTDLTNVRVHRDEHAAALAGQLGARAFTNQQDIYFNHGEYRTDTTAGEHLLAHELTHVKQQQTVPGLQYQLQIPSERNRYEQEADAMADKTVNAQAIGARNNTRSSVKQQNGGNSIQLAEAKPGSNWIMEKVSGLLRNIPGFDLLTLIIGRDPITGEVIKRDGIAFAKAIISLIPGGNLLFENLEKAKIISRAVAWFQEEFQKLDISFNTIKGLFNKAWEALSALDLLNPGGAFEKMKNIFLAPIQRVMNFIVKAGSKLMEFIFEGALTLVSAPVQKIMGLLNQGKGVLQQIIADPVGFLKNLLNAVRGGLSNFVANIGAHLQKGLAGWLFGTLSKAGIELPEKLNLVGIFHLVAQILGVTWQAIRAQVVKRLGPLAEKVMDQVEKGIAFVQTLITKGPLALLEMAQEFIGELQSLFFDSLMGWVRNTIIVKAVQKLISMFNPVGAIIQAVITIYNTIQFFIERAKQIAEFVTAVFNSIAEIAGGNIKKAVAAVEDSLAKALPVAISFLANLVGIGGIATKIKEIIEKIRKPIDKVVGKAVEFIAGKAKALIGKLSGVDKQKEEPPKNETEHDAQVNAGLAALDSEQKKEDKNSNGALTLEEAEEVAQKVKAAYPVFKSITPVEKDGRWVYDYIASPGKEHEGLRVEKPKKDSKTTAILKEWLKDSQDLLKETRQWYRGKPEWWGINPDKTPVFYRPKSEVDAIRSLSGESGGHHPHGLALGGPKGQNLTPTGETAKIKNPIHIQVTGLQKRVINKIKEQLGL